MGWVVNTMPQPLCPQERPSTPRIGDWMGLRAGLDRCGRPPTRRDSISGPPSRSESLYRLSCPGSGRVRTKQLISSLGLRAQQQSVTCNRTVLCTVVCVNGKGHHLTVGQYCTEPRDTSERPIICLL